MGSRARCSDHLGAALREPVTVDGGCFVFRCRSARTARDQTARIGAFHSRDEREAPPTALPHSPEGGAVRCGPTRPLADGTPCASKRERGPRVGSVLVVAQAGSGGKL